MNSNLLTEVSAARHGTPRLACLHAVFALSHSAVDFAHGDLALREVSTVKKQQGGRPSAQGSTVCLLIRRVNSSFKPLDGVRGTDRHSTREASQFQLVVDQLRSRASSTQRLS